MKRLLHIEGLRAYLAFWVVFDHVLGSSGYSVQMLSGIPRLVRQGWFAVDIFIIISGFVIFYLLDHKHESYRRFITRRFFRLWPLFFLLFLIGIPTSLLSLANLNGFSEIYPSAFIGDGSAIDQIGSWWNNVFLHIGLHLPMMHGVVPDAVLPYAPSAFLGPAWSISLEWQFYLLAPLVFAMAATRGRYPIALICAETVALFLIGRKLPDVQFGAFLPMHIEFFFLGCLSYLVFKWLQTATISISVTPIASAIGIFIFFTCGKNYNILPIVFWLVFFGLLVDLQKESREFYVKIGGWLFGNKIALYLGKISYSIYLSHALVIVFCQFVLIRFFPELTQKAHLFVLAGIVSLITIGVSHILFVSIESPGMKIGEIIVNSLKDRKSNKAVQATATSAVPDL
jgi:peptidoglycan/LPS O-acetylase OafA/YrhL